MARLPVGDAMRAAAAQVWPPFVLVAGLLLIGATVQADGLFAAVGARLERVRGGPVTLLATLLGLEALVTAVLNLDTAVVFLTPIIIHAARHRGCDEKAFLYGALFMANGASLLLPGSNLTNLIVLAHEHFSGAEFARAMVFPWLIVILTIVAYLALVFRPRGQADRSAELPPIHVGIGLFATVLATALTLGLHNPALPVLGVGLVAVAVRRVPARIDVHVLGGLFLIAVALGTLARRWDGPASLIEGLGGVGTAAVGAVTSVLVNNLPAATLLSAQTPPHPLPLLIGLNLGPNLLFTGSLAAYLWYRTARSVDARPSLKTATLLGLGLAPLTIALALLALAVDRPQAF
jgi:arsenical pump membrane protein